MSKDGESEEIFVKIREEYFNTVKDGKEECLCRISFPVAESAALNSLLDKICDRVRILCDTGDLIRKYEINADKRERFLVTPYRFVCMGTLYEVGEGILCCKIRSTLDARFPGGVHILETCAFFYDEATEQIIPTRMLLPPDIRRKLKRKGDVIVAYADVEGIHLLFAEKSEYILPSERFLSYYLPMRRYMVKRGKKAKKGIDKRNKL